MFVPQSSKEAEFEENKNEVSRESDRVSTEQVEERRERDDSKREDREVKNNIEIEKEEENTKANDSARAPRGILQELIEMRWWKPRSRHESESDFEWYNDRDDLRKAKETWTKESLGSPRQDQRGEGESQVQGRGERESNKEANVEKDREMPKPDREKGEPKDRDEDECAGMCAENRHFIIVQLGGQSYRALFDPGAMLSLVGPRVAERFAERLEASNSAIRNVNGGITRVLGVLNVMMEIENEVKALPMKAVPNLDQDIILGMDFCQLFDVDSRLGRGEWRVHEGEWRPFAKAGEESRGAIFAECAGISELDDRERDEVERLVDRVLVYPPGEQGIGLTTLTEHTIDVQGGAPFKHHPRRMSPKMQQIAIEEVERMFNEGIIERSASDYSSAPVMIRKSDGTYRFCVDYRDLNKMTRKDAYPLPSMDSILDKLRRAKYLTKIDLKQAYYQIPMERSSRKYTAFAVPGSGLWQFRRMPFGLTNAPMTFQRLIDALFGPEFQPNVFGYLDDIIIATETFEEHLYWIETVLKRLVEAGLKVNREKCEFCCSRVTYLGFLLDRDGLRSDPDKVKPVLSYKAPTNVKELRRFLGMVGWYARFIDRESEIKVPLVRLLHKGREWQWGEEQQEAFGKLKTALTTAPVLARPDFSKPFVVQCDASNYALGAVLTQEGEDGEHPIVYISRTLNPAERNYTTTEKECLAMLWAIKKLRPYLEGYKFTVITDHSALKWLYNLKEPTGRLARWALQLQQWDFEILHRKGALNHVPDALSRMCVQAP